MICKISNAFSASQGNQISKANMTNIHFQLPELWPSDSGDWDLWHPSCDDSCDHFTVIETFFYVGGSCFHTVPVWSTKMLNLKAINTHIHFLHARFKWLLMPDKHSEWVVWDHHPLPAGATVLNSNPPNISGICQIICLAQRANFDLNATSLAIRGFEVICQSELKYQTINQASCCWERCTMLIIKWKHSIIPEDHFNLTMFFYCFVDT